ncbi:MAG TPA: helix-turn-helix transcriptional regulator [Candidatus Limnocylindrales bacterium]|jgi:transcriptional regulator with XRE-family HTH domain
MDDQRVGVVFRAVRLKKRLRQRDVAALAGLSPSFVSRAERGRIGTCSLDALRKLAGALDIRLEVLPRWRGGELDRLLSARHSSLANEVVGWLGGFDGWVVRPEVSFSIYGERGVIDLLAWHPERRALVVIELKTEIVDVGELLGTLSRKQRLARKIAQEQGWTDVATVSVCLIVADSRTNRRRIQAHEATLRAALPHGGTLLRGWLTDPTTPVKALRTWPDSHGVTVRPRLAPVRRVRRPAVPSPRA